MGNFQIQMSDKKEERIRQVLNYAQAKFQLAGDKYSYAKTIERIMIEWGKVNGFIDPQSKDSRIEHNNVDIRGNPQIVEHIEDLINRLEKTPTVGTARKLKSFIEKADPTWRPPQNEPENKYIIAKAREVFLDE